MFYSTEVSVGSLGELMDKFYKPERLNRPGGTRERLIADRSQMMVNPSSFRLNGNRVLLISHHDSVTGWAVYARRIGSSLQVTQE